MTTWLLLLAAIVCEVSASLSLKAALDRPVLYVVVVTGYAASFVLLGAVLRRGMALGVAYGIWSALGVVATAVMASVVFEEAITVVMGLGMALVILGILLVELGSHASDRDGRRSAV